MGLVDGFRSGDDEEVGSKDALNLTKLDCRLRASLEELLFRYRTIYMIGDSLLRQQFMVLLCMLKPSATAMDLNITKTEQKVEFRTKVKNTTFIFSPFGASELEPLYENEYPAATGNGTAKDLIVINAGHHYTSQDAEELHRHATHMVELARDRPIHVYFMETTDEQWPTSNGIYPAEGEECCCGKCSCEIVTPDKVRGNAALDLTTNNFTEAFGRVSPNRDILDPMFDPQHRMNHSLCVPDCYPANWKNELVRPVLLGSKKQKKRNIHIVPGWRQLVARKLLNNVDGRTDCTHKSVDVTIELNRQLLRSIAATTSRGRK
jgi:hypothetical protein